jgi:hypothetical protein
MAKPAGKFQYTRRSFQDVRKRAEQSSGLRDNMLTDHVGLWKPAEGENCIRILPPSWKDADHFGLDIFVHYSIGSENSAYLDLARMKGSADPITEAYEQAQLEGDEDYAKKLRSVKRVLVYVIDRDKPNDGPKLWAMPWTVDKEIGLQSQDSRTHEVLYLDDPEEGYDIYVSKEGAGERTKYSIKIARNSSPLIMTDTIMDCLENHPLPTCLIYYDYDYIKKVFSGKSASKDEEEEEKPPMQQNATRQPAARQPAPKKKPEVPTYDEVHDMDMEELCRVVVDFELELDVDSYDEDAVQELLDDVIKELGLAPPKVSRKPVREPEPEPEEEPEPEPKRPAKTEEKPTAASAVKDRLASLRNRR